LVWLFRGGVGLLIVLAGVLWLWHLSASSLFADEALSWRDSSHSLSQLVTGVKDAEINPLGYFVFLHAWIKVAPSTSELWLRVPSVIAGFGVVGALVWLTSLVAGRPAALLAGLLAAVSPYLYDYAQEVRSYVFAMVAVTVAAAALLQAERSVNRRNAWVALSIVAAAVAMAGHYTAWLVVVPLTVYLVFWSPLPKRPRVIWIVVVAVSGLVWLPLLAAQWGAGHNGWLSEFANLTPGHFGDVFGGPFSGRIFQPFSRAEAGGLIVLAGAAVALITSRTREVRLVVALALACPAVLLIATLVGHSALLIRYVAVAVPFMIAALAIALGRVPRVPRVVLVAGVLGLSLWNVNAAYQPRGRYMDMRGALSHVRSGYHHGDVIAVVGNNNSQILLSYYAPRLVPPGVHVTLMGPDRGNLLKSSLGAAFRAHKRIWLVNTELPYTPKLRTAGYVAHEDRVFPAIHWLDVILAEPAARRG
jgi:4-amino-4-deoxy-L-arabinose transferase-like glycosyltransferase